MQFGCCKIFPSPWRSVGSQRARSVGAAHGGTERCGAAVPAQAARWQQAHQEGEIGLVGGLGMPEGPCDSRCWPLSASTSEVCPSSAPEGESFIPRGSGYLLWGLEVTFVLSVHNHGEMFAGLSSDKLDFQLGLSGRTGMWEGRELGVGKAIV